MQMTRLEQERQKFLRRKSSCVGAFVTCFVTPVSISGSLFNLSLLVVVGGCWTSSCYTSISQPRADDPKNPTVVHLTYYY